LTEDKNRVKLLIQNKEHSLKEVYDTYHQQLFYFIYKYVRNAEVAEEITQDIFITLWQKRFELNIQTSLKSYLYAMAKNKSIDFIRKYFQEKYQTVDLSNVSYAENSTDEQYHARELELIIAKGIETLPEKCKIIFNLSRNNQLSYKEISETLNISIKTVEAQMGIAIKRMKEFVDKHWVLLCAIFYNLFNKFE
jgi:RNA polymerase sigma-70 factor, ECF subfamily